MLRLLLSSSCMTGLLPHPTRSERVIRLQAQTTPRSLRSLPPQNKNPGKSRGYICIMIMGGDPQRHQPAIPAPQPRQPFPHPLLSPPSATSQPFQPPSRASPSLTLSSPPPNPAQAENNPPNTPPQQTLEIIFKKKQRQKPWKK